MKLLVCFFFFNDTATTEIYTLSLHDALPISEGADLGERILADRGVQHHQRLVRRAGELLADHAVHLLQLLHQVRLGVQAAGDRKSTRLNSSHANISYAVFCLKKKKKNTT